MKGLVGGPSRSAPSECRPSTVAERDGDEGSGDVDGLSPDDVEAYREFLRVVSARSKGPDAGEWSGARGDRCAEAAAGDAPVGGDAGSSKAKRRLAACLRPFSRKSRQSMGEILIIVVYYAVGVAVYTNTEAKACEDPACEERCARLSALSAHRPPGMCMGHWTIVDAIYFITVSVSTVGYGDFLPNEVSSKVFSVVYLLIGMPWMFVLLSRLLHNAHQLLVSAALRVRALSGHTRCAAWECRRRRQLRSALLEQLLFLAAMFAVNVIFTVLFMALQPEWVPAYDEVFRPFNCTAYPEYPDYCMSDYDPKRWVMSSVVWHCFITALTIGYTVGPSEIGAFIGARAQAARLLSCFHILVCVTMLNNWWSNMYEIYVRRREKTIIRETVRESFSLQHKKGGDASAERYEFVVGLLVKMGKASAEEVTELEGRFAALGANERRKNLSLGNWRSSGLRPEAMRDAPMSVPFAASRLLSED